MTLRGTIDAPNRSVDTIADLEKIETGYLVDGDEAYVSIPNQFWFVLPGSIAPLSPTVRPTYNSDGGLSPGRWFLKPSGGGGGGSPLTIEAYTPGVPPAGPGVNTFTLSAPFPIATTVMMFVNGVLYEQGVAAQYTVAGNVVTWLGPQPVLDGTDRVIFAYQV